MTSNYQKKGGVPLQNTGTFFSNYYRLGTLLFLLTLTACGGNAIKTATSDTVIEQPTPEQQTDNQEPEVTQEIESPEVTPIIPESEQQEDQPAQQQTRKRILPLGDSITHGGDGFPSYRRSLWRLLKSADYDVDFIGSHRDFSGDVDEDLQDFDLDHEGHWAWETNELEDSLPTWIGGYTPDIVLLHTGTNDVDRDHSHVSTIAEINNIIDILRSKNPKVIVLLAKIIPMRGEDTAEFNVFIEDFAHTKNTQQSPIVIVDQYSDYSPHNDSYDKWHPNNIGEQKMANKWFSALLPYL